MSFFQTKIAKTASMVNRWHGRSARLFELTRGHVCITVLVFGDEWNKKNLMIHCHGPEHITGPVDWNDSELVIEVAQLQSGEEGIALVDKRNGLRITAESFEVKENVKW